MSDRKIEDMSTFELSRWYALMEAVNIIGEACDERGKNFNKMKISPLDVVKYIESTCDTYAKKIETENNDDIRHAKTRADHIIIKLPSVTFELQEV